MNPENIIEIVQSVMPAVVSCMGVVACPRALITIESGILIDGLVILFLRDG